MKKEYEKPMTEVISFEPVEEILTSDGADMGEFGSNLEEGVEDW